MTFLSCTKDIIKDVNRGAAIEFTVAAQTRAQEVRTSNLETFYATAVDPLQSINYYTDVTYTKSGQYFQSNPTYFWPGDTDHTLDIYAYAPSVSDLGASVSINRDAQKLIDFSPAENISEQQDFITAVLHQQGRPGNATPVQLTFQHRLAQIEIKAKNNSTVRDYWVEGVRIGQVKSKGDFNFSTNKWTLDEDKKTYEVTYDDAVKLSPVASSLMMSDGDNAMLLPQTFATEWDPVADPTDMSNEAYISVKVKSAPASGNEQIEPENSKWIALPIPAGTVWEEGHKYIYILDFSIGSGYPDPTSPEAGVETPDFGDVIHFEVIEWEDWKENDVNEHPLVGKWEVCTAHIEVWVKNEEDVLVKDQSFQLNNKEEIFDLVTLPSAEFITFISSNCFSLYTNPNLYYLEESADGKLYVTTDQEDIYAELDTYTEESMTIVLSGYIDPENSNGLLKVYLNYKKIDDFSNHYERPDEYNQWEECLIGQWQMTEYYHTFTYTDENGGRVMEEWMNCTTPEEVEAESIGLEPFYYVNFYSLMLWSDYAGGYHFTSFRNNRFVAISAYDDSLILYINDITDNSFNVTFSYPDYKEVEGEEDIEGVCDVIFHYTKVE